MTRFIVRATFDLKTGNAQMRDPTFGAKLGEVIELINPEAHYFAVEKGERVIYFIVTVDGSHDFPRIAEPLWFVCEAKVEFIPCIDAADLAKARPGIHQMVETYR